MAQDDAGTNWFVVGVGALLLALVVVSFDDLLVRAFAAVFIFLGAFYMARPREEPQVENPLIDQLRDQKQGLDRRKYGRLRSTTERLLDNVRQMNRIAIEGREGKLSPRHAHAELDRLAAVMRDIIDECRKAAGVPTPAEEPQAYGGKVIKSQVVLPKTHREDETAEGAAPTAPVGPDEQADESDAMLDRLEAQAEADARARERPPPLEDEDRG